MNDESKRRMTRKACRNILSFYRYIWD